MTSSLSAETIAALCLGSVKIQTPQTVHRLSLVETWNTLKPGDHVLEIGCGQGDMTAVLASVVGPSGHVIAIDPADPTSYGSPYTLKQAQDHLKASEIGSRITFVQADTIEYMAKTTEAFDAVVLAQCTWYFASAKEIHNTLSAIKRLKGSPKLLLAEFSLQTNTFSAIPHILAVLALAAQSASYKNLTSNVRTILSPASLTTSATNSGWSLVSEHFITPDWRYQDPRWEIGAVKDENFLKQTDEYVTDERQHALILALRDAALTSAGRVDRKEQTSMDVWVAVFE